MAERDCRVNGAYAKDKKRFARISGAYTPVKKRWDKVNGVWVPSFSGYDCMVQNLSPAAGSMNADGSASFTFTKQSYQRYIPMLHFTFSDPITFAYDITPASLAGCTASNDSETDYTMYEDSACTKAVARCTFEYFSGSGITANFTTTNAALITEIWLGVTMQAHSESSISWGSGILSFAGKQIKSVQIV